jgi:methylenetetrahydrofolate reductase (NADH)
MRNKLHRGRQTKNEAIQRLLEHARYEVLPTATTEEKVLASVPKDVAVTVTASASKGLEATLTLAESLAKTGYMAVPHLAARMIHDFNEVEEIRARLGEAGITAVFVPGGDADPVGVYPDSFSLLEDLNRLEKPFTHVGIAGYPESHPKIHDDLTVQAMWDKRRHATHIVSNLTFDAGAVRTWVDRMRARGITQPVLLGLPGPIDRAKLLSMATKIGVGESTRFLSKNAGFFAKLAAPGGWTGQRFLEEVAITAMKPESLIEGLHVFTFNQIAATEAWRQELLDHLR